MAKKEKTIVKRKETPHEEAKRDTAIIPPAEMGPGAGSGFSHRRHWRVGRRTGGL
jgi:hypothetical protein